MDAEAKLRTIAVDMHLEPDGDAPVAGRPPSCGGERLETLHPTTVGPGRGRGRTATLSDPHERQQAVTNIAAQTLAGRGLRGRALDRKARSLGIFDAVMPGGRRAPLLKTLLTSVCERNCFYCPFRAGRDYRRATFRPEEMAAVFDQMARARLVDGLFLSSGMVAGGVSTQDSLIATADILRNRLGYRGYLHVKIMPGADKDQVFRVMQLADRVSINLEAPNSERLTRLAPTKAFLSELLQPLKWVEEIRQAEPPHGAFKRRWPSTVTQFVVGAAGESDLELLQTTGPLVHDLRLARVYFSPFSPVPDTPLENQPAASTLREQRLYQAFFLFRDYGFCLEEMPFDPAGDLPLDEDPKMACARANLLHTPIELNSADRRHLLRVPGIGPRSADAILRARRQGSLRSLRDLRAIGVSAKRAADFVVLNGHRPARQLRLF